MKPIEHIRRLLRETHRIAEHGHCKENAAAFVAINDIEIATNDLQKAFEGQIERSQNESGNRTTNND